MRPQSGIPIPKPEPRRVAKARKDREDAKQLKAFRDAVWEREHAKEPTATQGAYARCQHCRQWVWRESSAPLFLQGEVHHRIGRANKATRYDPDNGVLLCHQDHGKAQRHEIET